MSTYILLVNYTDQGIRNIKDSPKRADAARELGKTLGVEMKDIYLTMGGYDLVITIEAPNDDAVAKFALVIGATGNVRSTTLRAFTEKEYRGIIDALP